MKFMSKIIEVEKNCSSSETASTYRFRCGGVIWCRNQSNQPSCK